MNLANIGLSGLTAAMHHLQTTGHNISNAATDGYNRQSVGVSTAGAQSLGTGYVGRGVAVDTVNRSYDAFLFRQLVRAESGGAALVTYGNEIAQVNNLLADRTVGISPALQQFFNSVDALASSPADAAARREMLGQASSVVAQINDANAFLDAQRSDINTQINTVVTQINSQLDSIQQLNQRIIEARAGNPNHAPNDLLDQRDRALGELNQLIGVQLVDQDGQYTLTTGNGQMLLGGNRVFPLQAVPSAADPGRTTIAYTTPTSGGGSTAIEINESTISGGSLGGLLQYRIDALDTAQNQLGRLATGLAHAFNQVHSSGYDQSGNAGGDFFSVGEPNVVPAQGTQGALNVVIEDIDGLTARDYNIVFEDGEYVITDTVSNELVYSGPTMPASVAGLQFSVGSPAPVNGDQWLVQPTRNAAATLQVAITDASKIAAAGSSAGDADGDNALKLAALRSDKTLGNGGMSFNEAYGQMVNTVAVLAQHNGAASQAQLSLIQQNAAAQQAVSGVNLNEEYVNMMRYQEHFRAASRLIDVSSTLFDTLLNLRS